MDDASEVERFPARLRTLAREKGLSVERVLSAAWDPTVPGTSPNTVKKVIAGQRPLQTVQVEAISRVLEVDPAVFPEYRLARAREELDERVVGLDEALAHLDRIVTALRQQAVRRRATEGARRERRHQGPASTPGEAASGEGA